MLKNLRPNFLGEGNLDLNFASVRFRIGNKFIFRLCGAGDLEAWRVTALGKPILTVFILSMGWLTGTNHLHTQGIRCQIVMFFFSSFASTSGVSLLIVSGGTTLGLSTSRSSALEMEFSTSLTGELLLLLLFYQDGFRWKVDFTQLLPDSFLSGSLVTFTSSNEEEPHRLIGELTSLITLESDD